MSLLACNSLEDKVQNNNRHAILVKEDINDHSRYIDYLNYRWDCDIEFHAGIEAKR